MQDLDDALEGTRKDVEHLRKPFSQNAKGYSSVPLVDMCMQILVL